MVFKSAFWLALAAIALIGPAKAQPLPAGTLAVMGPGKGFVEQFQYLADNWPWQHAVLLARVETVPECRAIYGSESRLHCQFQIVPEETIVVRWRGRNGPLGSLRIYLWYDPLVEEVSIAEHDRLILFLVPTRTERPNLAYTATMIVPADPETVKAVQRAQWSSDPD